MHRTMEKKLQDLKAVGNIPSKGTWETLAPVSHVNLQLFPLDIFSWTTVSSRKADWRHKIQSDRTQTVLRHWRQQMKRMPCLDRQVRICILLQRGRTCGNIDHLGSKIKPETNQFSVKWTERITACAITYLNERQKPRMSMLCMYRVCVCVGELFWY